MIIETIIFAHFGPLPSGHKMETQKSTQNGFKTCVDLPFIFYLFYTKFVVLSQLQKRLVHNG